MIATDTRHILPLISVLSSGESDDVCGPELFGSPVLVRTAAALRKCTSGEPVIVCWTDQRPALESLGLTAACTGERPVSDRVLNRFSVATHWDAGWRSALARSAWFDRGFAPARMLKVLSDRKAERLLYVDAASPFLQSELITALLAHAESNPDEGFIFSPAMPGLSGVVMTRDFIAELVRRGEAGLPSHAGIALHYRPDAPAPDPLTAKACAPTSLWSTRTRLPFRVDSQGAATWWENVLARHEGIGELTALNAETAATLAESLATDRPRLGEVHVEVVSGHPLTKAIFREARTDEPRFMDVAHFAGIMKQMVRGERICLAGHGEPLCHPEFELLLQHAEAAGIRLAIRTDLAGVSAGAVGAACDSPAVEVLQIMLPASSRATYARVMGCDALQEVMGNVHVATVHRRHVEGELLVSPVFVKTRENMHEMEPWYDHWLSILGSATISGPSDRCGGIRDTAVADMAPPSRLPCRRLRDSLFVTVEGRTTPCAEPMTWPLELIEPAPSSLGEVSVRDAFDSLTPLRSLHVLVSRSSGSVGLPAPCSSCRQWFRAA